MTKKLAQITKPINHLALIMDGNGRWAKKRGLPRNAGHREGAERIFDIATVCLELKIPIVSLYAFSSENWNRPQKEIDYLFNYLESQFSKRIDELMKKDIKVITMGDLSRLPESTQKVVNETIAKTKNNQSLIMNIALNYGGRPEIVRAAKQFASDVNENKIELEALDEAKFADYLYTKDLAEVDLLIRTSGEERLSNFMLWQLAYAELIFTPTYWPDFDKTELLKCIEIYTNRNRRFGGLEND